MGDGATMITMSLPINVKFENSENDLTDPCKNGVCANSADLGTVKIESEVHDEFNVDELDHIPLHKRIKTMLSRCSILGNPSDLKCLHKTGDFVDSSNLGSAISYKQQRCTTETCFKVDPPDPLEDTSVRDSGHGDGYVNLPVVIALFAPKYYVDGVPERNAVEFFRTSTAHVPMKNIAGNSCTLTGRLEIRMSQNKVPHEKCDSHQPQENVNINQKPCQSFPGKVKVENAENESGSCKIGLGGISFSKMPAVKVETEIHGDFDVDELDHMPLQARIKMLLFHKISEVGDSSNLKCSQGNGSSAPGCDSSNSSNPEDSGVTLKSQRCSMETAIEKDVPGSLQDPTVSDSTYLMKSLNASIRGQKDENHLQKESYMNRNPRRNTASSPRTSAASLNRSIFPIKVKVENPKNDLPSPCMNDLVSFSSADLVTVGIKTEIHEEFNADELDHLPLQERIDMLRAVRLAGSRSSNSLQETGLSAQNCDPMDELNLKASRVTNKRKRKKTATCSVETALEEDAPGLLQVLKEKGINVDEIRLYGNMEDVDPLVTTEGDSFVDLEAVIFKIFSQRSMLLKLAPLQHSKGARASYCLACLVSLIEQTRHLRLHKWPVEWGWCRDLQSFIFVFEKHNRIVLERPEYGFATYFFELVESLPIRWQIMRLVTAMKLTNCSRIALLENKSLLVGEDVTEGEAQALEGYGWKRNTGLGSMLNYCDRVVHDRRREDRVSDWRTKIGKLLMDGHDQGHIILDQLPMKVIEYNKVCNHLQKKVVEFNEVHDHLPKKVVEFNEVHDHLPNKLAAYNEVHDHLLKKVVEYHEVHDHLPKKIVEFNEVHNHLLKKVEEKNEVLDHLQLKVKEYNDVCNFPPKVNEYNEVHHIPQVKVEL